MEKTKKSSSIIYIHADAVVGVSDLKRNPTAVFEAAEGRTLMVLNHNRPVAYIIPIPVWDKVVWTLRQLQQAGVAEELLADLHLP